METSYNMSRGSLFSGAIALVLLAVSASPRAEAFPGDDFVLPPCRKLPQLLEKGLRPNDVIFSGHINASVESGVYAIIHELNDEDFKPYAGGEIGPNAFAYESWYQIYDVVVKQVFRNTLILGRRERLRINLTMPCAECQNYLANGVKTPGDYIFVLRLIDSAGNEKLGSLLNKYNLIRTPIDYSIGSCDIFIDDATNENAILH